MRTVPTSGPGSKPGPGSGSYNNTGRPVGNSAGGRLSDLKPNKGKEVKEYHTNDDVDSDRNAHHHTLGLGRNQAAPGGEIKRLEALIEALEERIEVLEGP